VAAHLPSPVLGREIGDVAVLLRPRNNPSSFDSRKQGK
jgi:hypothetical protein